MACKKRLLAMVIMALTLSTTLLAEGFDNKACYTVETDEGVGYIQRFEWQQIDYIEKFQFHLEQRNAVGGWDEIACIDTEDNIVEYPLDSGNYRYKIIVFNLLGQPELESEWIPIEIIKVYSPEIQSITPTIIYLEEPQTGIFTITGKGLLDSSVLTFKNEDGVSILTENRGTDSKNKELSFYIDPSLLLTGTYVVGIENEGGLIATCETPITVKYKKSFDLDISLGYTCLLNLFDDSFEEFFGSRIWPLSATAKISVIPFKRSWGNFGIGLSGTYTMLNDFEMQAVTTGYQITGNMIGGYIDFVYQYAFHRERDNKIMAVLEAHGGAGLLLIHNVTFHFPHNISTDPFSVLYLSAMGGGAVQLYMTNRLYLELNCDFTFSPSVDMNMGNLLPSLMIGWQF